MIKLSEVNWGDHPVSGIYKIINTVNDKIYIGKSINIGNRLTRHKNSIYSTRREHYAIVRAFNKYSLENFYVEIIEEVDDPYLLFEREQYYLDTLEPFPHTGKGYNMSLKAEGRVFYEMSDETRKKLSKNSSGKNNPMYGKTHSEETRKKMSIKKIGENNNMYGKSHSEETKRKISEGVKRANKLKLEKLYENS